MHINDLAIKEYISITIDGTKTYAQVMSQLLTTLTSIEGPERLRCCVLFGNGTVYNMCDYKGIFTCTKGSSAYQGIDTLDLINNVAREDVYNGASWSHTDLTNIVIPASAITVALIRR